MPDIFASTEAGLNSPAPHHFPIETASSTAFAQPTRGIYVNTGGTATIEDMDGVSVEYNLFAGAILPIRATKVTALGGGATLRGWW